MLHRVKGSHSGAHPMQPDEAKALRAYLRGLPSPPSPILFPSNVTRFRDARSIG